MRDRMEKFVLIPFTMGCVSENSVAVGMQHSKGSKRSTPTRNLKEEKEEEELSEEEYEESLSDENMKRSLSLLSLPRFQRLFKNFKSFSQFFVYRDEMDETETGMEIGFPTDVKHVTHIGFDGSGNSILSKSWDNLKTPTLFDLLHASKN